MSTPIDAGNVGDRYRSSRRRLEQVLTSIGDDEWHLPVAACPGWRIRDVLAHLVGIIEDASAGRLAGPPSAELTALEVDRHRHDDPHELLQQWSSTAPFFEEALTELGAWPAFLDVLSHEHDIRAAIGDRSHRGHDDVVVAARILARPLAADVAVECDGLAADPAGAAQAPDLRLRTTSFEVLRLRLGRRSRAQVLAMDWTRDPSPHLDGLFVFGPADRDVLE